RERIAQACSEGSEPIDVGAHKSVLGLARNVEYPVPEGQVAIDARQLQVALVAENPCSILPVVAVLETKEPTGAVEVEVRKVVTVDHRRVFDLEAAPAIAGIQAEVRSGPAVYRRRRRLQRDVRCECGRCRKHCRKTEKKLHVTAPLA